ncbi:bifunctional cytochrome P450/NADPH--P450 reductase [Streptomyces sp. NPDC002623]
MTDTLPTSQELIGHEIPVVDVSDVGMSDTPGQQLMKLTRRHGPVFALRLRGHDTLFVSDLDLVTEISDEQRFAKFINPNLGYVREFAGDGLFTAHNDEPNWAKAHDILMPAFALGSMRTYHPVMLKVARRLIESWDSHAAAGTPVDVAHDATRMTLDTIGLSGFGFDFESFDRTEPHPFVTSLIGCLDWAMTQQSRVPGIDYSDRDRRFRTDSSYLADAVDEVIAARTDGARPEFTDLLELMLTARHPADDTTLDLKNVRYQVLTFLAAGHETTSGTIAFALYHLAKHPESLRLVQREVDELWGDDPDPQPTYEDVGRMPLTRQVLNETLRLWPAAPGFSRAARQDTVIGGRIPLRAGQLVSVVSTMLHRGPVWGDNPELFDPFRFAPEAEAARSPHAFKPFGTGERACIGRQFAIHEAILVLGLLAHRYRLIDQDDYQLKVKEALTIKPDGFTLTLIRRTVADRAANRAALPSGTAPATVVEAPAADTAGPGRVRQGTGLLLLHGSNYGTCRDFATQLGKAAAEIGCDTAVASLDTYTGGLPTDRPVVITAASYNGQPTDDAGAFVRWLEAAGPGEAEGVTYAVLGVGDRNWSATYQRIPTFIDDRLAALGATRLMARGEADAAGDLNGGVKEFTTLLRTVLLEHHGDPDSAEFPSRRQVPAYTVTEVTGGTHDLLANRHSMTAMTVTETGSLSQPGYPRVKRLVRLALPEGTTYRTADHLTVLPANSPALVARAAQLLRADLDTVLSIVPDRPSRSGLAIDRPLTVRELLTHYVELQDRPTAEQLNVLAAVNPCPPEQSALRALAHDQDALATDRRTVLDLIEDHPALSEVLTWPTMLELLPPRRPRHYSISTSPLQDPHHVDLMVSVLQGPARSGRGTYRGAGSGYLNTVRPGDTVLARVQPCRAAFRIDHTVSSPVIMVAAGTGLAPFRGAIADRRVLATGGVWLAPALCYFGCDTPDADYLHADELRAAEQAGAVSMRPAFSEAPIDGRRFVQDRIAAEADEVWQLIGGGARVYVCGDGTHMAPGVRQAFRSLYVRANPGADDTQAGAWLQGLMADGRYVEDVYGG